MTEKERLALATLLRTRREALGISARELARRAGLNNATVSQLEQRRFTNPKIETVSALATALKIPLADVYAATNWLPKNALPSLRPYMRAKYGDLTEAELLEVEQFVAALSNRGSGPLPGEDE